MNVNRAKIRNFLRKHWKAVSIGSICTIIGLFFTVLGFYLQYFAPPRADLRILLDPSEAVWTHDSEKANFSVNGSLYNSGSSAAKVLKYSLSIIYVLPSGDMRMYTQEFTNMSRTWDVTNPLIGEKGSLNFYLSINIFEPFVLDETTGQIVDIRTSAPYEFKIVVTYDDGLGSRTCEGTYQYP
jgi:hypothetical protein